MPSEPAVKDQVVLAVKDQVALARMLRAIKRGASR
jgi:hypothetical protein